MQLEKLRNKLVDLNIGNYHSGTIGGILRENFPEFDIEVEYIPKYKDD